jgi:hypothetical protein
MFYCEEADERLFAPLIGQAIINFGKIEVSTLEVADKVLRETTVEEMAKSRLSSRVKALQKMLAGRNPKGEATARLISLLERCKILADRRNMIAHNPVAFDISYLNGKFQYTPAICNYVNSQKKMTYQELFEFCKETEALAHDFDDAIHGTIKEGLLNSSEGTSSNNLG